MKMRIMKTNVLHTGADIAADPTSKFSVFHTAFRKPIGLSKSIVSAL